MPPFDRITFNPQVMSGRDCIGGMRVTVAMVLRQLSAGVSRGRPLEACPYLEPADVDAAVGFTGPMSVEACEEFL